MRRSLFESLGGFDTRFFVYLEDLDFSLRASRAGWSSFYLTETQAYHRGGGTSEQVKATRLFYALRSRILYGYKHFRWTAATGLLLTTLLLEPLVRLGFALVKGTLTEVRETLQGYYLLWSTLPSVVLQMLIMPAKSITHEHLLSVVHTEMSVRCVSDSVVRLLDAGCGDGELIIYLAKKPSIA